MMEPSMIPKKARNKLLFNIWSYRSNELLIYWAIDLLSCWAIELMIYWAIELLSCWSIDLLSYWAIELLINWAMTYWVIWAIDLVSSSHRSHCSLCSHCSLGTGHPGTRGHRVGSRCWAAKPPHPYRQFYLINNLSIMLNSYTLTWFSIAGS